LAIPNEVIHPRVERFDMGSQFALERGCGRSQKHTSYKGKLVRKESFGDTVLPDFVRGILVFLRVHFDMGEEESWRIVFKDFRNNTRY
jgi:hypothetical protein